MSSAPQPSKPRYEPFGETRFAIVMYGGVSLAIYINGVVLELFRLVQATAPAADRGTLHFADHEVDLRYREIGRRLAGGEWQSGALPDHTAVRTRFVIDILSGTSAGGINAILLAKALANGLDIDNLKQLWIDEGDIGALFNERSAYAGLKGIRYKAPPKSLLAGQRLFVKALQAIRDMDKSRSENTPAPAYADELELAVTTTDLQGLKLPIKLADRAVVERRHRAVLRFIYADEGATGAERNDFEDHDDLLAFAARATSSFPFAFEPVLLSDLAEPAGLSVEELKQRAAALLPDYLRAHTEYEDFAFADGGDLDNKPFTHATAALRRRRADVPVERKLLYIEPDPVEEELDPQPPLKPPDALGNVGAAVGLPRVETIREDIAAVSERNEALRTARSVVWGVEDSVLADDGEAAMAGPAQIVYQRLRREQVVTDLAVLTARGLGLPPDSDEARVIQFLLDATTPADGAKLPSVLNGLDLPFRLRRLNLLQDRINQLLRGGRNADRILAAAGLDAGIVAGEAEWLGQTKKLLNDVFVDLRVRGRAVRRRAELERLEAGGAVPPGGPPPGEPDPRDAIDFDALGKLLAPSEPSLLAILDAADPTVAAAELIAGDAARQEAISGLTETLSQTFQGAFSEADQKVRGRLGEPGRLLAPVLLKYYEHFELLDMALLPLVYPGLGETNPVDILRVSPVDANNVVDVTKDNPPPKLAGTAMHHFGGFLDEGWRRSDLLWGRLDGAERIIDATVPKDAAERSDLLTRLQAAILREEFAAGEKAEAQLSALLSEKGQKLLPGLLQGMNDKALLDLFRLEYRGPPPLDAGRAMKLAGRGVGITGDVLESASRNRNLPTRPAFWLARLGRLLWGFAELVIPDAGGKRGIVRYLPQLVLLTAGVLILAGGLGLDGAATSGWALLGTTVVVLAATWVVRALLRMPLGLLKVLGVVLVVVLLVFAGAEIARHLGEDIDALLDWLGDKLPLV